MEEIPIANTDGGGGVGVGGKVRRERKAQSTPYDRPSRSPWISRFVDPAKRLFSLFTSPSPSSNLVEDNSVFREIDEANTEAEEEAEFAEENCPLDPVPESTVVFAPSEDKGKSKLIISDEDGVDKGQGCSSGGLPDIEQLISGKKFSREEIEHLTNILHTRVVDGEQDRITPSAKGEDGVERVERSSRRVKSPLDEEEEFQLATSTSLHRSTMQDASGASPVDIAKAYMRSRTSDMGFTSTRSVQKTEKLGFMSQNFVNSIMSSPLQKAPICWPGAITQSSKQEYSTPPNRNNQSGFRSFSRTPYSRTVYSKSKSKLYPLRGDSESSPSISPAPFRRTATPFYEKVQSTNNVVENSYRTGGPIRRTRDKFTLTTPTRDSPLFTTARKSPFARESSQNYIPKKTFEQSSSSKINTEPPNSKAERPEARVSSVHPHSNRLAWKILEQLDKPVTLKEHSKELTFAFSQKDLDGVDHSGQTDRERNILPRERSKEISGLENVAFGSMISGDKTNSIFGVDNGSSPSFGKVNSQRSSEQGFNNNLSKTSMLLGDLIKESTTIADNSRSGSQNPQRKPVLASIAIEKPSITSSFSSITSPSFTFPVTTSSITSTEPPTPSITPSFLTNAPPQPKSSPNFPTFNFSNKITIAPPVIPVSSKTSSSPNEALVLKFKFGSEKPRLSFAVPEDDDISAPSDGVIPRFKFGSGESRLNFGMIGSDALCC